MTRRRSNPWRLVVLVAIAALASLAACVPVVHNFTPTRGGPGTDVAIDGEHFASTAAGNEVKIGTTVATNVRLPQENRLLVTVPPGARTGQVSVTVKNKTGKSKDNFIVPGTRWTFMVYVDGDNNLESAAIDDFLEMAGVGSTNDVNVVVQMDRRPGYDSSYGDWTDTRRFLVNRGATPSSAPVQNLGEANMGDPAVLRDFVEWAITSYPAERYLLSIWNHGGGWRLQQELLELMASTRTAIQTKAGAAQRSADAATAKAVAWDDTDGDVLFMREVQQALEEAKARVQARTNQAVKLDVVGFDACLMGMMEVAYALRNTASYVVGSEEVEPGDGWPYDTILSELVGHPDYGAKDLAGVIVTKYAESYASGDSVTQSALDVAALENVASKIDAFTAKATGDWATLRTARSASRHYTRSWSVDLGDFATRVSTQSQSADIRAAALDLRTALDLLVVNERHGTPMSGSRGLAIYFPETRAAYDADPDRMAYTDANTEQPVDFVKMHGWDNWLLDGYLPNNP